MPPSIQAKIEPSIGRERNGKFAFWSEKPKKGGRFVETPDQKPGLQWGMIPFIASIPARAPMFVGCRGVAMAGGRKRVENAFLLRFAALIGWTSSFGALRGMRRLRAMFFIFARFCQDAGRADLRSKHFWTSENSVRSHQPGCGCHSCVSAPAPESFRRKREPRSQQRVGRRWLQGARTSDLFRFVIERVGHSWALHDPHPPSCEAIAPFVSPAPMI